MTDASPQPTARTPRPPFDRVRWWMFLLPLATLFASLGSLPMDRYAIGPGDAPDVLELVSVDGSRTYDSEGKLLITTASLIRIRRSAEAAYVWLHPDLTLVTRQAVGEQGCETDEEAIAKVRADMESSKVSAKVAAYRYLGRTVRRVSGARVLAVEPGAPADGRLRAGDVIVAVDGVAVNDISTTSAQLRARDIGDPVRITVRRGSRTRQFRLRTRPSGACSPEKYPVIGVHLGLDYRLPDDVNVDTMRIGGPSAGLVIALAIVDRLLREDLTRGHTVAVTGTIRFDDRGRAVVGPIGAIHDKVMGARAAGADVFIMPAQHVEAARAVAPSDMRIIGVTTLADAVEALRGLPPSR